MQKAKARLLPPDSQAWSSSLTLLSWILPREVIAARGRERGGGGGRGGTRPSLSGSRNFYFFGNHELGIHVCKPRKPHFQTINHNFTERIARRFVPVRLAMFIFRSTRFFRYRPKLSHSPPSLVSAEPSKMCARGHVTLR